MLYGYIKKKSSVHEVPTNAGPEEGAMVIWFDENLSSCKYPEEVFIGSSILLYSINILYFYFADSIIMNFG